jgi:hypothetical protein
MSVSIPDNILDAVRAAAIKRRISVEEFVSTALAAQSSTVLDDPYLESRAKRATGAGWDILDRVPAREPDPGDALPED